MAVTDKNEVKKDTVTLTIDGIEVTVPKGTNLIEAAKAVGKHVPHYCYHPSLSIDGNCRLCLVEVKGMPKLTIGCNTMAQDSMEVFTESEQVKDAQKGMMEFLLVNHPLDCPVCDRGGECQLQRFSMEYGLSDGRAIDSRRKFPKEDFDPLIDLERNRCIVCQRCVRFMDQLGGERSLVVVNRGNHDCIATYENEMISGNRFSGNVVDLCPVGALTSKPYRFKARNWELQQVQSTCTLCSSGCRVTHWVRNGEILRTTPPTRPKNKRYQLDDETMEFICNAGRFGHDFANSDKRLMAPLVDGEAGEWNAAIDETAKRLNSVKEQHGADAVGFLIGGRSSCEEMYQINQLARGVVKTNNIDWRGGLLSKEAAKAWSVAFDAANGQLADPTVYDTILLVNADIGGQSPVDALKIKESARFGYSTVVSVGYRHDPWFANRINATVQVAPHQTAEFIGAMGRILTSNGEILSTDAANLADTIQADHKSMMGFLSQLQNTERGLLIFGLNDLGGLNAPAVTQACLEFSKTMGDRFKLLPFAPDRNARGAFAMGVQPDRLPGGPLNDDETNSRMTEAWRKLPKTAGLTAPEMLQAAADGKLKALYVLGAEALWNYSDSGLLEKALSNLELLIVQDNFPSQLTDKAHIVLPGNLTIEGFGTYADLSGYVIRSGQGRRPLSRIPAQQHCATLGEIMLAMGNKHALTNAHDVFVKVLELVKVSEAVDPDALLLGGPGESAPIWPHNTPEQARPVISSARPFSYYSTYKPAYRLDNQAIRQDTEAKLAGSKPVGAAEGDALTLTWAPVLFGKDPKLDLSPSLDDVREGGEIEIAPHTGRHHNIADGDTIVVSAKPNGDGVKGVVKFNEHMAKDTVFFAQNGIEFDATSGMQTLPAAYLRKAGN
ncbi:molybdopterin-dependent oxidoreductase [Candidatus Sumerlaeota bacterium]|nr:molybdopterin-dependent oxidoreductase [Candidatus Sumerlaeota bacterium]